MTTGHFIIDLWSSVIGSCCDTTKEYMMKKLRTGTHAMHEEQKEERRQDILTTAWQLFQTTSYEAVTIARVAEFVGLAKGTIFLYFKTKEALFLALLEQQLGSWFTSVHAGLLAMRKPGDIPQITAL